MANKYFTLLNNSLQYILRGRKYILADDALHATMIVTYRHKSRTCLRFI